MTLTEFLLARITEDEARAEAAADAADYGRHHALNLGRPQGRPVVRSWTSSKHGKTVWIANQGQIVTTNLEHGTGQHIARWSPARVLAECEAKRRIVAEALDYSPELAEGDNGEWAFDRVLHALAQTYADHPDFDPAWAVEGR